MDQLIQQLNAGILPDELNYSGEKHFEGVDIAKLQYNAFYRSYDYYLSRFPRGMENLPGFEKVIEYIQDINADNSPLKEIEIKSATILDNERGDISDSSVISISE
jgi:hypothetical protein